MKSVTTMEGRGPRKKEPMEGKDTGRLWPETSLTKLPRVAIAAQENKTMRVTSLGYLLDKDMLRSAWGEIRKNGAPGIDAVKASQYAKNLKENLGELHQKLLLKRYRAPPVRRVWIPKANGKLRPIGIPTTEDKILQRAVVTIREAVFEPNFLGCSYGFRPGRNAHQALESIQRTITLGSLPWVLELDIEFFFDNLNHEWLTGNGPALNAFCTHVQRSWQIGYPGEVKRPTFPGSA